MLAKQSVEAGGSLHPLLINSSLTKGTGITNPSVFVDGDDILVNIRHVEYTLFHSEKKKYCHPWGPIQYVHPENDLHLRTNNYLGKLDKKTLTVSSYSKIDTKDLDKEPLWDFVGLEDGRIVRWDGKLYLSGVRRDTTTNGQGRMELSEIVDIDGQYKEISRVRIAAPGDNNSYCEKNWMPVLDMPFHYVKWCNPTQVVRVDPKTGQSEEVFLGKHVPHVYDFRGGSQVIPYKDYRICIVHQCDLYKSRTGRKDARYRHLFIVWDKEWNVVHYGEPFSFLEGEVEFCCGGALYNNDLLVTFGFQDNSAFLLRVPEKILDTVLGIAPQQKPTVVDFFPFFSYTGKELLELRINMLKDHVDKFVICESNKTQSGIPIDYELEKTIQALKLPKEKIEIIELDIPDDVDSLIQDIDRYNCYEGNDQNIKSVRARTRERLQKDSLLKVLDKFNDNTVFIVSDSDEIIKPDSIEFVTRMALKHKNVILKIPLVHLEGRADLRVYNKDTDTPKKWDRGMFVCTKQHLLKATPTQIRSNVNNPYQITYLTQDGEVISELGWHFSWMGDAAKRKTKCKSFTHYNDTFSFLNGEKYSSKNILNKLAQDPKVGDVPPSNENNTILKKYPINLLPKEIFKIPKVKNYLLPKYNIVDCVPFFNEKELLELRINVLKDYVDEFLIFDANYTHSGIQKNYTCQELLKTLDVPHDKIKVINVDLSKFKKDDNPWVRESYQRDFLTTKINDYSDDTVFIVSDCDEIIDPAFLSLGCDMVRTDKSTPIRVPMILYYGRGDLILWDKNTQSPTNIKTNTGTFLCTKEAFKEYTPTQIRQNNIGKFLQQEGIVVPAGWHFSWMGTASHRKAKCRSFLHYKDVIKNASIQNVNSAAMMEHLENYNPEPEGTEPLTRDGFILKAWDISSLPKELDNLPHIKNFLIPQKINLSRTKK